MVFHLIPISKSQVRGELSGTGSEGFFFEREETGLGLGLGGGEGANFGWW